MRALPNKDELLGLLVQPMGWISESLVGLSAADLEARPFAGKWSYREFVDHIVGADLGWTNIMYEAVRPLIPGSGVYDPRWRVPFDARCARGIDESVAAMADNHHAVIAWLEQIPADQFIRPFAPREQWMIDGGMSFVIADQGRWGLVLHPYYHLAYMHRHRLALGNPLPAMERYLTACNGFDPANWPPWRPDPCSGVEEA